MEMGWAAVTRREAEILEAVRERLTNAEIGARFFISERTVESHVSSLLRKLQVRDRVDLAALERPGAASPTRELPGPLEVLTTEALVGRSAEVERLRLLWAKASAGRVSLGIVTGEAGAGKSRLVAQVAADAHAHGARVFYGACPEDAHAPYQPLADAVEGHAVGHTDSAAHLLGLHRPEVTGRATLPVDPRDATAEVTEVLSDLFRRLAAERPIVLVIEDLHWAGGSTRDAIVGLVRSADPIPLLVLATARDTAPDLDVRTEVFLGQCTLLSNSERVELDGLDSPTVGHLLDEIGSDLDPGVVHEESGGNPLLIRELARSSGSAGRSLTALLAPRYDRLDPDSAVILDAAAVLGATFDAGAVGRLLDRSIMDVVRGLDQAEVAGLVTPIADRLGRFCFVHPLFRTLHYERLSVSTRLELHHRAAVQLEQEEADERVVAALAHHACAAAPIGDARAAIRHAMAAAEAAERSLALDEAAHHYRQALAVTALLPEDRRLHLQLTTRLGDVLIGSGDQSGRALLANAADSARDLGDGRALADIAWGMVRFTATTSPGARDEQFVAIAEDALGLLDGQATASRARVLAALAIQLTAGGDPERGHRCVEESLRIARGLDDPTTLGVALLAQRYAGGLPLRPEHRLAIANELVDLGRSVREPIFSMYGSYTRAWSFRELGDLASHDRALDEYQAQAADRQVGYAHLLLALARTAQDLLRGDLSAAECRLAPAYALAEGAGADPLSLCGPLQFVLAHARGEAGDLSTIVEERANSQIGFRGTYEALLAVSYAYAGRTEDARQIVRKSAADGFASLQPNLSLTTGLALFAEAAELTGEADAAAKLLDRLEPHAGLIADNGASLFEPVDLAIAKACLTSGDPVRSRASAERLLTSNAGRAPVFEGRALVRLAAAAKAGAGSIEPTEALVARALAIAGRTGALVIQRDAVHYGLA